MFCTGFRCLHTETSSRACLCVGQWKQCQGFDKGIGWISQSQRSWVQGRSYCKDFWTCPKVGHLLRPLIFCCLALILCLMFWEDLHSFILFLESSLLKKKITPVFGGLLLSTVNWDDCVDSVEEFWTYSNLADLHQTSSGISIRWFCSWLRYFFASLRLILCHITWEASVCLHLLLQCLLLSVEWCFTNAQLFQVNLHLTCVCIVRARLRACWLDDMALQFLAGLDFELFRILEIIMLSWFPIYEASGFSFWMYMIVPNVSIMVLWCGVQAGKYVTSDVTRSLVVVISNANDLQGYTVRTLFHVFQAWDGQVLHSHW